MIEHTTTDALCLLTAAHSCGVSGVRRGVISCALEEDVLYSCLVDCGLCSGYGRH